MTGLLKFVALLIGMVLFLGGSGYVIFSHDEVTGMFWGIGLWFIPFSLFVVSIIAIVLGKLPRIGIRSRISGAVVLLTSLIAGLSIVLLAFGNAFVIQAGGVESSVEEKVRWYARFTGQTTMQSNAYKVEGEHATYYVTKDNEHKVEQIEEMLPMIETQLDRYLPALPDGEKPEIELHRSASTLQLLEMDSNLAGVYSIITGRIDVHENSLWWEETIMHEYTHYRVHQYQLQEVGKHVQIPHWLEEGFAQAMTSTLPLGPFDSYRELSLKDASSKVLHMNNATHDVYTYGQILTLELIKGASTEQLREWLVTKDNSKIEGEIRALYQIPENVTTQDFLIDRYDETLAKDSTFFTESYQLTSTEWEDAWETYKSEMYFPMYGDYLRNLRMVTMGELEWDESERILDIWRMHDYYFATEEYPLEKARLIAGRGDLKAAIALLEDSIVNLDEFEQEEMKYMLHIFKLLHENPQHPEALEMLESRSIFWGGTDEWLQSLQSN